MHLVAVIQARMGSERLPGKVLLPIGGKPVIAHVIGRARRSGAFDDIVLATTERDIDDPLAEAGKALGAIVIRGDEYDVQSRFLSAIERTGADGVVRLTADCPLLDPAMLAEMAAQFRGGGFDYFSNCRFRSFPRGLDAEFVTADALRDAASNGCEPRHREHVTPYFYENPDRYRIGDHIAEPDRSNWRWTLDTPEDLTVLTNLITEAGSEFPSYAALSKLYSAHPEWHAINSHIEQKKVLS